MGGRLGKDMLDDVAELTSERSTVGEGDVHTNGALHLDAASVALMDATSATTSTAAMGAVMGAAMGVAVGAASDEASGAHVSMARRLAGESSSRSASVTTCSSESASDLHCRCCEVSAVAANSCGGSVAAPCTPSMR